MADLRSYTWLVVVGALAAFLFGFGTGAPGVGGLQYTQGAISVMPQAACGCLSWAACDAVGMLASKKQDTCDTACAACCCSS